MKIYLTFFFLSTLLFLREVCIAQVDLPKIIPPSPDVASLLKYVEIPITHSTGVPDIGIPIYTVNAGKLSLPISLSYHAGGIKVRDIASIVGLGWSLNAGGTIARTVLANGSLNPNVLRINVWKDASGKVWTLDHRRLAAFKLAGLKEAPIQWGNPSGQMWKMTTTNGGTSIKLKLGGGNVKVVK